MFDVTQAPYNAAGDGTTDDRAAIQDAIDDAGVSGGVVYFPKGTYLLDSEHPTVADQALVCTYDNVFLKGDGRGVSILKMGDDLVLSMYDVEGVTGGGVSGLEFDGNRANNTNGHSIRAGGDVSDFLIKDVYIHDSGGYGIGLQFGNIVGVTIQNALIEDTGLDGVDVKNASNGNKENKIDNVTVRRAGLRTNVTDQACIDLRGQWVVSNIHCEGFSGNCTTGIRFRHGETTDSTGYGGHTSSLNNFYINAASTSGTVGVEVNAQKCQVSNGYVTDCGTGFFVSQQENVLTNCIATDGGDGFMFLNAGLPTEADRCIATGCIARSNTGFGFYVESDNVQLNGIVARGNSTKGVKIDTAANQTIISGESQSNTGGNIQNLGTNTVNVSTVGWGT